MPPLTETNVHEPLGLHFLASYFSLLPSFGWIIPSYDIRPYNGLHSSMPAFQWLDISKSCQRLKAR
jgi:hypothetical protein